MINLEKKKGIINNKVIAIGILLTVSIAIILSGSVFSIVSIIENIAFPVLNSTIHGAVFGLVVVFLGVRYFLAVQKLKIEVFKTTSVFSWRNFKKCSSAALPKTR